MPLPASADLDHLRLIAFDPDDLHVMSAHLQDAIVKVGDLAFLAGEHRFAIVARRFDWESAGTEPRRRLSGLHVERVLGCRTRGIDRADPDGVLSLLALTFEPRDEPAGTIRFVFAGGGAVELDVECLEVRLKDIGPVWASASRPTHGLEAG